MTTRTDRIRQHLERHGYHMEVSASSSPSDYAYRILPPDKGFELAGWTDDAADWNEALHHFVNDASKTGARQEDLGQDGYSIYLQKHPVGDGLQWFASCRMYHRSRGVTADSIDAVTSDLWRLVFIDPEDNQ